MQAFVGQKRSPPSTGEKRDRGGQQAKEKLQIQTTRMALAAMARVRALEAATFEVLLLKSDNAIVDVVTKMNNEYQKSLQEARTPADRKAIFQTPVHCYSWTETMVLLVSKGLWKDNAGVLEHVKKMEQQPALAGRDVSYFRKLVPFDNSLTKLVCRPSSIQGSTMWKDLCQYVCESGHGNMLQGIAPRSKHERNALKSLWELGELQNKPGFLQYEEDD